MDGAAASSSRNADNSQQPGPGQARRFPRSGTLLTPYRNTYARRALAAQAPTQRSAGDQPTGDRQPQQPPATNAAQASRKRPRPDDEKRRPPTKQRNMDAKCMVCTYRTKEWDKTAKLWQLPCNPTHFIHATCKDTVPYDYYYECFVCFTKMPEYRKYDIKQGSGERREARQEEN